LTQGPGQGDGCGKGGVDPNAKDREKIPDDYVIARGGVVTGDQIRNGSGVTVDDQGKVSEVSVNKGKTVEEATRPAGNKGYEGIPHNQVGVTTAGKIRAAGGRVQPDEGRNPNHALVSGLPPDELADLFEQQPNPNAKKKPPNPNAGKKR
jgi:hypothetical protein